MKDQTSRMPRMPDPAQARRGLRKWWLCFAATVILAAPQLSFAAAMCIPQASGVPALSGAPNFIDSAAGEPTYWPRQDDPRWRGAAARGYGSGASEHASFRALRTGGAQPQLYLSWNVKVDPQLDPNLDSLRVAFSTGASPDVMFEVIPFTTVAANINAATPIATQTRTFVANAWTNAVAEPTWLKPNTRVWLDTNPVNQSWSINMRVPLVGSAVDAYNTGLYLPAGTTQFRIAYALQVTEPMNAVTYYAMDNAVTLFNLGTMPAANTWPLADVALAPGAPGCEQTITLLSSDVGTTNVDGGGIARPNEIKLNATNTFFALVNNETGVAVNPAGVSATFRIANWGTQPDWNQVADPTNSLWTQIGGVVTNGSAIAPGTKASLAAGNAPTFNWTMNAAERCRFTGQAGDPSCPNVNPTHRRHQCMLVELSGAGLSFNPASVYRNMDFVDASTFEREAQVSVAGLAPLGGGVTQRDVFLYVQKRLMPKDASRPDAKPIMVDYAKVREILDHGRGPSVPGVKKESNGGSQIPPRPPVSGDFDVMNQLYPTYVVHAFHDSGKTVNVNGQNRRLLYPQSSFGYYVHHDGSLTGWDTALEGAQLVAPNYYRIAAPEGGSATVKTRIVAREHDTPQAPSIKWWWWLIALIVLVLLFLLLRRKSGP